jgi:hypothetical protein
MGLLDQFANLSPEQNQGLLAAAAQLLQAGGPSRMPTNLGQAFGQGLQAFQQGTDAAQQRKMQQEQAQFASLANQFKLRDLQSDYENQEAQRKRAAALQEFNKSYFTGGGTPAVQTPQFELSSTPKASMPGQVAISGQPGIGGQKGNIFEQRMAYAQALRSAGYGQEAAAAEKEALQFQPKVKNWQEVRQGDKVLYAPFFEDGTNGQPVPLEVAKQLEFRDGGGTIEALDSFTGKSVRSIRKTMSPDAIAANERAKEANQIAAGTKVATTSTNLRKEFDDLPEVKSYKMALPAFNAIRDAVGRNTTQSDINIVYGLAKLYDPTSVVREGEYATVANSPNIPERIKGYAQYLAGGGRLTPETKRQIMDEATGRIGSYETEYSAARNNYSDIAKRSGADSTLLFPSEFKPAAGKSDTSKTISLSDIAETARRSGKTTAEVTAAARAKGYTIGGK